MQIDLNAHAAAVAHLAGGAGQPGRTHVLNAEDRSGSHRLQASFEQQLFEERVADLDVRPLCFRLFVELARRHRRTMDAIAAGFRPHVNDGVARARSFAEENGVLAKNTQRERIDQRIAVVARFEKTFSADGRHAKAVAVVTDPAYDSVDDTPVSAAGFRVVEHAEAKRVHHGDGPRAHREDVPQNAADARCRTLERLNETRVVVRFDLERSRISAADVDDPSVLARTDQHAVPGRRQVLQMNPGAFIRAMFAPHDADDSQLCQIGFAPQAVDDAIVFARGEAMQGDDVGCNRGHD